MRQVTKPLGLLGILALLSMMLVMGIHLLFRDDLFFHCDAWSMTVYLGMATLLISPVLLLGMVVARWLPEGVRAALYRHVVLVFATLIVTVFLRLTLSLVVDCDIELWPSLICLAIAAHVVYRKTDRQELLGRAHWFGLAGFVLVFLLAPLMIGWNHLAVSRRKATAGESKHLLFIVLDGFPAHYLNAYNDDTAPTAMDETLRQGRVFREVRTSSPYTNGFFGRFYTGRLDSKAAGNGPALDRGNLLGCLQRRGVKARWIVYHRNGYPEGSAAQTDAYSGLRSCFLTENYTWIPDALGLDYHVAFNCSAKTGGSLRKRARRWLLHQLNGGDQTKYDNVFVQCLLPNARQLRQQGGSTFTLFHVSWKAAGRRSSDKLPSAQWKTQSGSRGDTYAKVRSNDYRYDAAIEPLAAELRQEMSEDVAAVGATFAEFLAELRNDRRLRDTTVLVTADHGTMYCKGRFWYGYHPNQEVVKVLCATFGPEQQPGVDDRRLCTVDLTASVLDYFDVRCPLQERAASAFRSSSGRDYTATLTMRSKSGKRHEWWLAIIHDDGKYWFNLDPQGSGETIVYRVNTFDEIEHVSKRSPDAPAEMMPILQESLRDFGISQEDVHPAFRQARLETAKRLRGSITNASSCTPDSAWAPSRRKTPATQSTSHRVGGPYRASRRPGPWSR